MLLKFAAGAAVLALSLPTFAQPVPPAPPAPPAPHDHRHDVIVMDGQATRYEDMTPEQRAKLDAKMKELAVKMARLSERLKVEGGERDARIKLAMERAHEAVERAHTHQISAERIREITERAQARAMAGAEAGRRAAEAAERAVERVERDLERADRDRGQPLN